MTSIRLAAVRDISLSTIGAVLFSAMIVAASALPAQSAVAATIVHA